MPKRRFFNARVWSALGMSRPAVDYLRTADEDLDQAMNAWPVGSVFITTDSTNPATLLGYGTWVAFGAGRVLVGVDSGDPDFNVAEQTGGAKSVAAAGTVSAPTISGNTASATTGISVGDHASHTHSIAMQAASPDLFASDVTGTGVSGTTGDESATLTHNVTDPGHTHGAGTLAASAPTFTGSATSVVQPYIAVHMWRRTA